MSDNSPHFILDPRLETDSLPLAYAPHAVLRVIRDARFPWLILVPTSPGLADLIDMEDALEAETLASIRAVSVALRNATRCDKLNVASLGNQVRQLHIHIIARFEDDPAWPGPVWGSGAAEALEELPDWAIKVRSELMQAGWTAS